MNEEATRFYHEERHAEAKPLMKRVLALREELLGLEHIDAMISLVFLAAVAIPTPLLNEH